MMATAVDGVILIDARGSVLMFNSVCERLFQYRASEVIGQNIKMLMPGPYREEHNRYVDNFNQTGERKIIGIGREVFGQRKDGTTFPINLSVGEAKQDEGSIFVSHAAAFFHLHIWRICLYASLDPRISASRSSASHSASKPTVQNAALPAATRRNSSAGSISVHAIEIVQSRPF